MKIGIILYTQTGHTCAAAQQLQQKLTAAGHTVSLEQIKVEGDLKPGSGDVQLAKPLPDTGAYDFLIFGSPVQAFSLSLPMNRYLTQLGSLEGKKVAFLVTQALPCSWMGGNRTVRQMASLCKPKGALLCGSGIIHWGKDKDQQTAAVTDKLCRLV